MLQPSQTTSLATCHSAHDRRTMTNLVHRSSQAPYKTELRAKRDEDMNLYTSPNQTEPHKLHVKDVFNKHEWPNPALPRTKSINGIVLDSAEVTRSSLLCCQHLSRHLVTLVQLSRMSAGTVQRVK